MAYNLTPFSRPSLHDLMASRMAISVVWATHPLTWHQWTSLPSSSSIVTLHTIVSYSKVASTDTLALFVIFTP